MVSRLLVLLQSTLIRVIYSVPAFALRCSSENGYGLILYEQHNLLFYINRRPRRDIGRLVDP